MERTIGRKVSSKQSVPKGSDWLQNGPKQGFIEILRNYRDIKIHVPFQDNHESFHRNLTGNTLRLPEFKALTDGGRFHCQVENIIGTSSTSLGAAVTVESNVSSHICQIFQRAKIQDHF